MMIAVYATGFAFLCGSLLGAGGMNWYAEAKQARQEAALAKAQAEVDALAVKAQTEAANKLIDMQAAYAAGESKAKVIYKQVYQKGQAYVANNAALSNAQCFIPADGLQLIAAARAGIEPPALASGAIATVLGPGAGNSGSTGRGVVPVGNIPVDSARLGGGSGVQAPASGFGADGQVPSGSQGRLRPKPKPVS